MLLLYIITINIINIIFISNKDIIVIRDISI